MYSLDIDVVSLLLPQADTIEETFGRLETDIISTFNFWGVNRVDKLICGFNSSTCKNIPRSIDDFVGQRLFEMSDGTLRVTRNLTRSGEVAPILEECGEESLLFVGEFTFFLLLGKEVHGFTTYVQKSVGI